MLYSPRMVASAMLLAVWFGAANAATPWPLSHASYAELKKIIAVNDPPTPMALLPQHALQKVMKRTDEKGRTHTRFQQYYAGFLVWGGEVVLHVSPSIQSDSEDKNVTHMNGVIYQDLQQDLGEVSFDFMERANRALEHFKEGYASGRLSEAHVTPLVYVDEAHQAHWAYEVSVLVEQSGQIPKRPTAILDAQTFEAFVEWNAIKTWKNKVNGRGFGGNISTAQAIYGENKPLLELMRDPALKLCTLENEHVSVWHMYWQTQGPGRLLAFNCELSADQTTYWTGAAQNGYDKINGAYSPSNDALYIGTLIQEMYTHWYGIPPLGTSKKPLKLVMRVHYGMGFENAFWDGKAMTFGDGGETLYPLVALSVGAHEVSHGLTEQYSNLIYMGQSGGMNEAFSDMAAQAIEYFAEATNSWVIGAEIMKPKSRQRAIRFMANPSQDGKSINSADKYRKGMDVHYSSGVYNRFFYLLAHA